MKVFAHAEEWWPVYELVTPTAENEDGPWSYCVDLPNDFVDRYRKARKTFMEQQKALEVALDKARTERAERNR